MADRKDWMFKQVVTEGELDSAFDDTENATRNLTSDVGLGQQAHVSGVPYSTPPAANLGVLLGGIHSGIKPTLTVPGVPPATSDLVMTVSAGLATDWQGKRIRVPSTMTVDMSFSGSLPIGDGGHGDGAATDPGPGLVRWMTLAIKPERVYSDPRVDGTGATVYFKADESFQFVIVNGTPFAGPTDGPRAHLPTLTAGLIVVGEFLRNNAGRITDHSYKRRGDWIRTASTVPGTFPDGLAEAGGVADPNFIRGTVQEAVLKLRDMVGVSSAGLAAHKDSGGGGEYPKHPAKNLDYAESSVGNVLNKWKDGTTLAAEVGGSAATAGIQGAIDEIIRVLGGGAAGTTGSAKISSALSAGSPDALTADSVFDQLVQLLTHVNNHLNSTTAHTATNIVATVGGERTTVTAQGQLGELDSKKASLALNNTFTGYQEIRGGSGSGNTPALTVVSSSGITKRNLYNYVGSPTSDYQINVYHHNPGGVNSCLEFAFNAYWDPNTSLWLRATGAHPTPAMRMRVGLAGTASAEAIRIEKAPFGPTWADTAWEVGLQIMPSAYMLVGNTVTNYNIPKAWFSLHTTPGVPPGWVVDDYFCCIPTVTPAGAITVAFSVPFLNTCYAFTGTIGHADEVMGGGQTETLHIATAAAKVVGSCLLAGITSAGMLVDLTAATRHVYGVFLGNQAVYNV